MDLTYREAEVRDFDACRVLMQDQQYYSQDAWAALPTLWRQWLVSGALNAAVMEYRAGSSGPRIIQFGMSVFVTDQFLADVRTDGTPHLGSRLVDQVLAGRSPVLGLPAIRAPNSGDGLNLLVIHFGFSGREWTPEQHLLITSRLPESFFWLHQGYNLREILIEFYSEPLVQFCRAAGFLLRSDYQDFYLKQGLPLPSDEQHPRLLGLTREEAAANPGVNIAKLFPYHVPRFFFSYGEQKVLLQALLGRNDEEIAASLDVALSTVKKRWAAIYDCVAGQLPEMLPEAALPSGLLQKRGHEKRRQFLTYLRQHPEELRPALPRSGVK